MLRTLRDSSLLSSLFFFFAYSSAIYAAPIEPVPQSLYQVDGTQISAIRKGDEFFDWYETEDGLPFLFNRESNQYEYARIALYTGTPTLELTGIAVGTMLPPSEVTPFDPDDLSVVWSDAQTRWKTSLSGNAPANTSDILPAGIEQEPQLYPGTKRYKTLAIIMDFADYQNTSSDAQWHNKLMGSGSGTVNHYMDEATFGKAGIVPASESAGTANDGIVRVTLPHARPDTYGLPSDEAIALVQPFMKQALEMADPFVNFGLFDTDPANGELSAYELQILFIYPGSMVAHVWTLWREEVQTTLDGYQLAWGAHNGRYTLLIGANGDDISSDSSIRTVCHEFGHSAFFLPDLYKTPSVHGWGIMGSGAHVHFTAYSKLAARLSETHQGFVQPTYILPTNEPVSAELHSFISPTGDYSAIRIPMTRDEFMSIDHRIASGDYDINLTDSSQGVRGLVAGDSGVMIQTNRAMIFAGGYQGWAAKTDLFYPGNNSRITPASSPSSDRWVSGDTFVQTGLNISLNRPDPNGPYVAQIQLGTGSSGYCESYTATNDQHLTNNRAYSETETAGETCWGSFCWGGTTTTTYYANGSNEILGTSGYTQITLKESPEGYYQIGDCETSIPGEAPLIDDIQISNNSEDVIINVYASDVNEDIVRVDVRIDSGSWAVTYPNSGYQWEASWLQLATRSLLPGNHLVETRVWDSGGRVSLIATDSFTIGEIEPTAPGIDTFTFGSTSTALTITGTASDINNDLSEIILTIYDKQIVCDGTHSFSCIADISSLAPGEHEALLIAVDSTDLESSPVDIIFTVPEPDTTPPVITLSGNNPLDINQFSNFVDPGAVALDNVDGNITNQIVVSGSVDTENVGSYLLTYTVSDRSGNESSVNRTVNVNEVSCQSWQATVSAHKSAGRAYSVTETSGQTCWGSFCWGGTQTTTWYAEGSDENLGTDGTAIVSLYLESATVYRIGECAGPDTTPPVITLIGNNPLEVALNSVFTDPGATASDNVDGNLSEQISVSGVVDTTNAGSYMLSYDVSDTAGNAALTVTRIVNVVEQTQNPCITSDNRTHIAKGRAIECTVYANVHACAKGSGDDLGFAATYYNQTSSVEESSSGYWVKVTSCP